MTLKELKKQIASVIEKQNLAARLTAAESKKKDESENFKVIE